MATSNLNPTVVPPTAAEIAAAVAAPSASTIAAAVTAPSSSTIATAVAAAVPTIGAINTAVANNAPSPFGWTLLGTGSLTNVSSATVSFSAYRKLRIVWRIYAGTASGHTLAMRFNGDSNMYYSGGSTFQYSGQAGPNFAAQHEQGQIFLLSNQSTTNQPMTGAMEVEHSALTTGIKYFTYDSYYRDGSFANWARRYGNGAYRGTSAITSVTLYDANSNAFLNYAQENNIAFQVFGAN